MNDLFTFAEALRMRDAGMTDAAGAQFRDDPEFFKEAYAAIERVARRQLVVHLDDVIAEKVRPPRHVNSWGPVWQHAARSGLIQRTNQVRECRSDPIKRGRRTTIYFSRVYNAGSMS